ncbi:MAG: N-acetylneuraminate synthase family protein [Candidatus Thorarchaeota archaeon]
MSLFISNLPSKNYCYTIAEVGVNYILASKDLKSLGFSSSLEVAFRMVDLAKSAGVDAIKFQSFITEHLQFKGTKKPQYQRENIKNGENVSYFDFIKSLEPNQTDQIEISKYCAEKEITFLSTPYDEKSVDFLDEIINVPFFKLASIELNNHLFIRYVAKKGKPILLSTGLSTLKDIKAVVEISKKEGFIDNLVLLQCTSDYPTKIEEINLNVLKTFKDKFPNIPFGFSDHSTTHLASIAAVAIGAVVVEKHFTLDKSFRGSDHTSSLNPQELKKWVEYIRNCSVSLGSFEKKITKSEKKNETMRKYLVITPQDKDIVINESMLMVMRTGKGILPIDKNLKKIIGKRLKIKISEPSILEWNMIY